MSFSSDDCVLAACVVSALLCLRAGGCVLTVDFIVLCGDGVEGLVSVDHRAKHHRLQQQKKNPI